MIDIDDTRKNVTSLFKLAIENQPSTWLNILGDITEHVDGLDLGESQLRSTIEDGIKSARLMQGAHKNQPTNWLDVLSDNENDMRIRESQLRSTIADGIKSARLRLKKEEGALNKLECIIK